MSYISRRLKSQIIKDKVLACAKASQVPLVGADVLAVSRVKRLRNKDGVIHIVFSSVAKRNDFLSACRKKRLICDMIGFTSVFVPVFVNEVLSPQVKYLLFKAKQLQREKKWRYVWVKGGMLWV